MQLTNASEYAIRAVMNIARTQTKNPVNLKKIITEEKISHKFLSKILKKLEEKGILKINLGKFGGYSLAKKAEEISVLEVIEAVEGKIFLNRCLSRKIKCCKKGSCALYKVWERAQERFVEELARAKIGELAGN